MCSSCCRVVDTWIRARGWTPFSLLGSSASTCDLLVTSSFNLKFSRPPPAACVGFGMFAFCSPWPPYAAHCPVPLASDDAEIIPELSSPGMLMTSGRLSRCGRNHGHRQSALAHQVPCSTACCGPGLGLPLSLHAAAACGQQPTSVSALSSRARTPGGTDPGHRRRRRPGRS